MKNYKEIFSNLLKYYKEEFAELEKEIAEAIAKIEVFLYVLEEIDYKEKDISKAWTLLTGYHKNEETNINFTCNKINMINKARGFLVGLYGSTAYKNHIEIYKEISNVNELMYSIKCREKEILFTSNNSKKLMRRKEIIKNLFESEINIKKNKIKLYNGNLGVFNNEGIGEVIDFTKRMPENTTLLKKIDVKREVKRKEIVVKKNELLKIAQYIDSKIPNKNYVSRVKNISFDVIKSDSISKDENIKIDGLFNLVGRVGAGKSTLVEVLSCKLALEGKKTGIVVDSIKSIVELFDFYNKLGIKAVPIWSYTGKDGQRNKAYASVKEEDFNDVYSTSWNKLFSETCILDGLRNSSDILEPFEAGKEPCLRILKDIKSNEKFACPYYNICPSHEVDIRLIDAQVYITTQAAFLKTKISPVIIDGDVRVSEYLYYNCDLVVFDESDRVQLNFEQSFTEHLVLMDHSEDSYLNKLGNTVERWFYKNRLLNASNKKVKEWYDIFNNTQRIANILIQVLNDNKSLIKKLNGSFSTAFSLHGRFISKRKNNNKTNSNSMNDFIRKGERELDEEVKLIRRELLSGNVNFISITEKIKRWYFRGEKASEDDVLMIVFIFILNIFEKNFKNMVNGLENIAALNDLSIENASIMFRGIEDYLPFIPTSPAGNKFGIRVTADNNNNLKRLVLFKSRGLGRWLLTNYHNMYENLDNEKGPNVLLLSGTSWAPKSYSYHIDRKVDAILNGNEDEAKAIEESEFTLDYILVNNNAIEVSGTDLDKRVEKIKAIINGLIKTTGRSKKSKLVQELERLEENRKRILLLVGNYSEVAEIKRYFDEVLSNDGEIKKGDVCLLVRDDGEAVSDEDISRGDVTEFGIMDKKILIAPLMALERGYNILNEESKAAIGSVYFLVRPMPVPNDISIIINKINSKTIEMLNNKYSESISDHIEWVKSNRDDSLRLMQELLIKSERLGYKQLNSNEREALCMTLFVTMCQVIGRLIRGGCKARVHFCDAKFAPNTVKNEYDTEKTSILVGIIKTLDKLMKSEDVVEKELAYKLYYPFYKGLKECGGLKYVK